MKHVALALAFLAWLLAGGCKSGPECTQSKTVAHIGGCDAKGWCGVAFTDGTFADRYRPVVGQSTKLVVPCPKERP